MSLRAPRRLLSSVLTVAMLGLGAGTVAAVAAPTAAYASSYDMESQFVAKLNAARQSAGLAPYAVASDLVAVARNHSAAMASRQELYHNPSLTSDVHNWRAVGENVGEGPTVSDIHQAFMQSPEHRANILDHDFTQVGVGVSVDKNGIVWVTEDFRQPMSSSPAPSSSSRTGTSTTRHHHASSRTSSGRTSTTRSTPRTAVTNTGRTATGSAHRRTPRPVISPRAMLMHRWHQLQRHPQGGTRAGDPVAQSFDYVAALSRLTR